MTPKNSSEQSAKRAQNEALTERARALPLERVMVEYLGQPVHKVEGKTLKFLLNNGVIVIINTTKQAFGAVNGFKFQCLRGKGGSSNNAINLVEAVRETEGRPFQFIQERDALLRQFEGVTTAPRPLPAVAKVNNDPPLNIDAKYPDDPKVFPAIRDYLVGRGIEESLVEHLHGTGGIRAVTHTFQPKQDQPNYKVSRPAMLFPVIPFTGGNPIAAYLKILPAGKYPAKGLSEGPISQGAFVLGSFGKDTRRLVVTEGAIDGISKWLLEPEYGDETCIASMGGTRVPKDLLPFCAAHDIEVVSAYDNDFAGRSCAERLRVECEQIGVKKFTKEFADPADLTLRFANNERCDKRIERLTFALKASGTPFVEVDCKDSGWREFVMPATEASMLAGEAEVNDDKLIRRGILMGLGGKGSMEQVPEEVSADVLNKDWNDKLLGKGSRCRDWASPRVDAPAPKLLPCEPLVSATPDAQGMTFY